jgi:hypothetical protein
MHGAYKLLRGDDEQQQQQRTCWGKCPRFFDDDNDDDSRLWLDDESLESHRLDTVLERLTKYARAFKMQLAGMKHDDNEAMQEAAAALALGHNDVARGHVALALQHRAMWARNNAKYTNLNRIIISLREASRNLETATLFKESNQTLGALRERMDEMDVKELLDNIREHVINVGEDSELLAESVYLEATEVDDEFKALLRQQQEEEALNVELPTVVIISQQQQQQLTKDRVTNTMLAL